MFVPRKNRSKTCGSSSARIPGPESRTSTSRRLGPRSRSHRHGAAARRELQRVADQVGEQLHDALAVETQLTGRPAPRSQDDATLLAPARRAPRPRLGSGRAGRRRACRAGRSRRRCATGRAGWCSASRAGRSARSIAPGTRVGSPRRPGRPLELGVHAQGGDRRPQLMAHVGDELAQPIAVGLEHAQRTRRGGRPSR